MKNGRDNRKIWYGLNGVPEEVYQIPNPSAPMYGYALTVN